MYFCRSQSAPAIADQSAFVQQVMHRIAPVNNARSLINRRGTHRGGLDGVVSQALQSTYGIGLWQVAE